MMGKRILDGQGASGKRHKLSEAIPLDTPYSIQIFPIYACNFKCNYCMQALAFKNRPYVSQKKIMSFELYKKCIDDLTKFPRRLKLLHFTGLGEPLMHPRIVDMVKYAKEKNDADTIAIITNASLLTHELSDRLIDAGLDMLRISLQGVNDNKYKEISQVTLNFEQLKENIAYFYMHKNKAKVYVKIMDCLLEDDDEKIFIEEFKKIADSFSIEHLFPSFQGIDYSSYQRKKGFFVTRDGVNVKEIKVCPQPFYTLTLNPDGDVLPCCKVESNIILGNCNRTSMIDLWNSKKLLMFRRQQLKGERASYSACENCMQLLYTVFPEDELDNVTDMLLEKFME